MKTKNRHSITLSPQLIMRLIIMVTFLLFALYIISRFARIISGPSIVLAATTTPDEEHPGFIQVQGAVKNTETLLINNYPVVPAVDGGFEYTMITQPGYSTIELQAFDRFNNQVTKIIMLHTDEPPDPTTIITPTSPPQETNDDIINEEDINNDNLS